MIDYTFWAVAILAVFIVGLSKSGLVGSMGMVSVPMLALVMPARDATGMMLPVLLAMQADGIYMAVEDRGPAMLVFPYDQFHFDRPAYDAYWVWQIKTIHVQ